MEPTTAETLAIAEGHQQQQGPAGTSVNTGSRKDPNSSREGKPYQGHQGTNNGGMNTSTAGLTAANETARTAGDTYNKTGINISKRRHFYNKWAATKGTSGRLTTGLTAVQESTGITVGTKTTALTSTATGTSITAGTPESLETPLAEKRQKQ
jgi:hypothetical protein